MVQRGRKPDGAAENEEGPTTESAVSEEALQGKSLSKAKGALHA